MKIRFEFGSEDSRKFSFQTGTPQEETSDDNKREYSFDTSKIKNEDAREFAEDVLSIFSTAARGLKDRIAEYERAASPPGDEPTRSDDGKAEGSSHVPADREPTEQQTAPAEAQQAVLPDGPCGDALVAAGYGERSVEVIPFGSHGAAVVPLQEGDDEVEVWRAIKEAVGPSGCYPVYVMQDDLERPLLAPGEILDLATADRGRLWAIREQLFARNPWPVQAPIADTFHYKATVRRFGHGPTEPELAEADLATEDDLDEFLWRWERATFGDEAVIAAGQPDDVHWFDPGITDQKLLVVPVPDGPNTVRVLGFYPTDDHPDWIEPLGADLAAWHRDFGAELIANYGTMLQFVVNDPPRDLDTAYQLAKEHDLVATSTLPAPGLTRRHYAADLIGRTRWFLHDRP
ncbi:MAG: DUF4253 domain-containing protein [Acidimicrobiia bacterium]|nr:DUF4253 domain-containing protein [Acidimicrobiia bacterium]